MLRKTNLKTNEPYTVLVLQGNAIVLQSKATSRSYVSARKTTIACALDDVWLNLLSDKRFPVQLRSCLHPFRGEASNREEGENLRKVSILSGPGES